MAGRAVKSTETAPAYTNIGIIDVSVNNVGDDRLDMLFQTHLMGLPAQCMKIGAPVKLPSPVEI